MEGWPQEVELVAAFLRASGAEARIEELPVDAATADAAADAVGCTLSQIVKSLVFLCDDVPAVVLAPGDRRVDSAAVARLASAKRAAIARPEQVLAVTGFTPGAVAPFPLPEVQVVLVERTLLRHHAVWAGAGSSRHLVRLSPTELLRLSRGRVEDVVRPSA
jgi:prolyl-tRNA editing enzyme YbaK/EbsC (Cys-tRNA(Pro) deacylase)